MNLLAGILIWFAVFIGTILMAKEPPILMWDILSFIIVIGIDIAALVASSGTGDFISGIRQLAKKEIVLTKSEMLDAAYSFDLMNRCSVAAGLLGFVMGLVMMLVNLQSPDIIGPYIAVCLISVLYGLSLSLILFMPGKTRLHKLSRSL